MAQRGGSVNTHVRWNADRVFSAADRMGEADAVLVFERPRRSLHEYLKPDAWPSWTARPILPITARRAGRSIRPTRRWRRSTAGDNVLPVPGGGDCPVGGNAGRRTLCCWGRCRLSGSAGGYWLEVIAGRVPARYLDLNARRS